MQREHGRQTAVPVHWCSSMTRCTKVDGIFTTWPGYAQPMGKWGPPAAVLLQVGGHGVARQAGGGGAHVL